MSNIRKIKSGEYKETARIIAEAYPGIGIKDIEKFSDILKKRMKEEKSSDFYALFEDDEMHGLMKLFDFRMNYRNEIIDACGVGCVAVDLMHKKEKVCKQMIEYYHNRYRKKGFIWSLLYPFRPDFYIKMGYGYGIKMNVYKLKPSAFPYTSCKSNLKFLSSDSVNDLLDFYNAYTDTHHGMIKRSDLEIKKHFDNPGKKILGYIEDGIIKGYMVFTFEKSKHAPENFLLNNMVIHEFLYDDYSVFKQFSSFINSQNDQIDRIIYSTQDRNFYHLIKDPENRSFNVVLPVGHETNTSGIGLMYRIINLKKFFEEFKYDSNESLRITFNIEDSFLPVNEKKYKLNFDNGRCEKTDKTDVEVEINISTFSSIAIGSLDFKSAVLYGLATITDKSKIKTLDKIFNYGDEPYCITSF